MEVTLLYATAAAVAFFHTLSPDHWSCFVIAGRLQNWRLSQTVGMAILAGLGHVGTSVIISLVGLLLGAALAHSIGSTIEIITGGVLILFGFGYAFYAWRSGGHAHVHAGGDSHQHIEEHEHEREYSHTHAGEFAPVFAHAHAMAVAGSSPLASRPVTMVEHIHSGGHVHLRDRGHTNDYVNAHQHDHAHDHDHSSEHVHEHPADHHEHHRAGTATKKTGWGLVAIIGLTPCVALIPLVFAAATNGTPVVITIILIYAVLSLIPMAGLTWLGSKGLSWVKMDVFDKYGDILTGVLIGCVGLVTMALGI